MNPLQPLCSKLAYVTLDGTAHSSKEAVERLTQDLMDCIENFMENAEADAKERDEAAYADHIDRQIDRMRDGDL